MMEFVLELIFDIIVEGSIALGSEKKVPMPLRILALLIVLVIFGGFAAFLFIIGYDLMIDGQTAGAVLFYAVAVFFVGGCVYQARKMFRARDDEDGE